MTTTQAYQQGVIASTMTPIAVEAPDMRGTAHPARPAGCKMSAGGVASGVTLLVILLAVALLWAMGRR